MPPRDKHVSPIKSSKLYSKFHTSPENRKLNPDKHRKLFESVKRYGMLPWWPAVVTKLEGGVRTIKDGQHRHEIAKKLEEPFYYVEIEDDYPDFDISVINDTQRTWSLDDYILGYADSGDENYIILCEFAESYGMTYSNSLALLSGNKNGGSVSETAKKGLFEVTHYDSAVAIAEMFNSLNGFTDISLTSRVLEACQVIYHIPGFNPERMIQAAEVNSAKLRKVTDQEDAAVMLDDIYNARRQPSTWLPLKFEYDKARKSVISTTYKKHQGSE